MPSTHHAFPLRLSLATYRRGLAIVNAVAVAAAAIRAYVAAVHLVLAISANG